MFLFQSPSIYPLSSFFIPSALQREAIEDDDVFVDGLANFKRFDVFVGCVTSCRIARTHFQAGEWHQCLVAERGRSERRFAQHFGTSHHGVRCANARWIQSGGVWRESAFRHSIAQYLQGFLV